MTAASKGSEMTGLDDFTRAYLECAFWSSTDEQAEDGSGGYPLDENYGLEDLDLDTLRQVIADCAAFQADHARDIAADSGLGDGRAGHDFWLTRNGHGAGFWDGDWAEDAGARMTAASRAAGALVLYVGDDGKVYGFPMAVQTANAAGKGGAK